MNLILSLGLGFFLKQRKLGSVQLGLSGGEPMLRKDIEILVEESCKLGFFTNLITSGIGLTEEKIDNFKNMDLDKFNYPSKTHQRA